MKYLAAITFSLVVFCSAPYAQTVRHALSTCDGEADPGPCVVTLAAPYHGKLPAEGASATIDGNMLVMSYRGQARSAQILGDISGVGAPMAEVAHGLLQKVVQFSDLARTRMNVLILVTDPNGKPMPMAVIPVAGPEAPSAPERGQVSPRVIGFESFPYKAQVWLPPAYRAGKRYPIVYVGDSGGPGDGTLLAGPISRGDMAPVIVVGLDACPPENPRPHCRSENYLDLPVSLKGAPERFQEYERFLVQTVIPHIEGEFGRPPDHTKRAIAGASNSADWAAAMALRHPDLFGTALVMSPAMGAYSKIAVRPPSTFRVTAGVLEPAIVDSARCLSGAIADAGGIASLALYPAGHSPAMWERLFVEEVADWLAPVPKPVAQAGARPADCDKNGLTPY